MDKFDLIVIGMGPAGMAVSAMGAAMGLKVLAVEKNKVGGECLNVGCIPSKALLKGAEALHNAKNISKFGIDFEGEFKIKNPLHIVREKVEGISSGKFMKVFEKVKLISGSASFTGRNEIQVNSKKYRAKRIYIAAGSKPFIPPVKGIDNVEYLTNENIFNLETPPESLMVIGGGAIGCEMALAFRRLGTEVTLAHIDSHLLPLSEKELGDELEKHFRAEGIEVLNNTEIKEVRKEGDKIRVITGKGEFVKHKLLVAAGRRTATEGLDLKKAGVDYTKRGIKVNKYLKTSNKNVYAIGDVNGYAQFSHAAMHQGMLSLMHAVSPFSFGMFKYRKYFVPWSVFTDPEIAGVGMTQEEAEKKYKNIRVIKKNYESYGRSVADSRTEGFIKIITKKSGRILGVSIAGSMASEMIHEWALALHKKMNIRDIMMIQHSFPTMSMLNKMVAEDWMMGFMKGNLVRKIIRFFW